MTEARRLLIIAYTFPPMPTVGANRWDAMARHLRIMGHDVTVVSTSAFGTRRDATEERYIRRAADLTAARWLRRALRRGALPPPSDLPTPGSNPPAESPLPVFLRQIFVPDLYAATWVPQALRLARSVIAERHIECVITTSPYESAHLVGLMLPRRTACAWVADFRDGWSFEPHRPGFPTRLQRWVDHELELRIARRADAIVAATEPITSDFRTRLNASAIHIANGFDPLQYKSSVGVVLPDFQPGSVTLVHTGKLVGPAKRHPGVLFRALNRFKIDDPESAARIKLLLAGRLDTEEMRVIAEAGLDENIVVLGELSRIEALELQRQADVLLLLTSPDGTEATGKLFEYLSAGRPILALASSTAAKIVARTGTGIAVPPDDVDAIYRQLQRLASGSLPPYAPHDIEPYLYPAPAERMSEVIETAIARRMLG